MVQRLLVCFLVCTLGGLSTIKAEDTPGTVNLLSLQEGTLPIGNTPFYGGWPVVNLLDESPTTGWACEEGRIRNNVFLFEMLDPATLERFEFDTAGIDAEGAAAKEVLVEVSVTGAANGFVPVLQATLRDKLDGQLFKAEKGVPARWVRLTVRSNYGSGQWCELFSFRGYGIRPAERSTLKDVSGTYESSYSLFHVRQQGSALMGCYEYSEGLLDGSLDGRLMKLVWSEGESRGPAVMVFSEDGRTFRGFWWREGMEQGDPSGEWDGKKISAEVGGCPHGSGSVGGEMKRQLNEEGRARVYGILFDLDSAQIRSESFAVLDDRVAVLQTEADGMLTIEGHTDSSGTAAHNQDLSQKRAESVKAYLVKAGIAAGRLTCKGLGQSRPLADNATELGRAQNRRVELVKVM